MPLLLKGRYATMNLGRKYEIVKKTDTNKNKKVGIISNDGTLFINHYKSKSLEEWNKKLKNVNNQEGYMKNKWSDIGFDKYEENDNVSKDTRILRFVPPLERFFKEPLTSIKKPPKYFLVMVCMFKYEDDYLDEWLRFHILQGVEHFYLYDNENPPETQKVLQPYINANYITLIHWPNSKLRDVPKHLRRTKWNEHDKLSVQNLAFKHFAENFKKEFQWAIKVDVDEFVYPKEKYKSVKEVLLKKYPVNKIKGIEIHRKNFGSGGLKKKPKGLVIANYTRCAIKPSNHKSIGNSNFIKKSSYKVHSFAYK